MKTEENTNEKCRGRRLEERKVEGKINVCQTERLAASATRNTARTSLLPIN